MYLGDKKREHDVNKPYKIKKYNLKKEMVPSPLNFSLTRYNPNNAPRITKD